MQKIFRSRAKQAAMAEETAKIFSVRVRQARMNKGITQQRVADEVGISKNSYQDYELGRKTASFATLPFLADCLDVSIDYLLGRTDVPQVVRSAQWQANQEP